MLIGDEICTVMVCGMRSSIGTVTRCPHAGGVVVLTPISVPACGGRSAERERPGTNERIPPRIVKLPIQAVAFAGMERQTRETTA